MSQKNCSFFGTCNYNEFFPTKFLKLSPGQLRCSFDKTSEIFQTPSELFYSRIRESMEKHLVQKNNSRYPSGQLDCRFDKHAEKFSPKFWYLCPEKIWMHGLKKWQISRKFFAKRPKLPCSKFKNYSKKLIKWFFIESSL